MINSRSRFLFTFMLLIGLATVASLAKPKHSDSERTASQMPTAAAVEPKPNQEAPAEETAATPVEALHTPNLRVYVAELPDETEKRLVEQARVVANEQEAKLDILLIPGLHSPNRLRIVEITKELDALNVTNLPAAALIDTSGKATAKIESWPQDRAQVYAVMKDMFTRMRERDAAFAEAAQTSGVDRAAALHRALQQVGPLWSKAYLDEAQAIVVLDKDNAAGLAGYYIPGLVEIQIDSIIQERVYALVDLGRYIEAAQTVAHLRQELPVNPAQSQMLLGFEGQLLASGGQTTLATHRLQAGIQIDPTSPTADQMRGYLLSLSTP